MKATLASALPVNDPVARAFRSADLRPLTERPGVYPAQVATRLAEAWRQRASIEYRSSTVFTQLSLQLVEANAPLESTAVMASMAQDELRHAHGCREVLAALGHSGDVEIETSVEPLASHRGVTPEERALRNVLYTTCCSESVACARFVAALETTTDPFFRQALSRLLADERLHAQFGFHYLAWSRPFLERTPEVRSSVARYLRLAFATLEQELAPSSPHALDPAARAVGLECPVEARELFFATMTEVVVPALESVGIEAGASWATRSLTVP